METITKEQYSKLNKALYNLESLLSEIGVKEFCISHNNRELHVDTNSADINFELLEIFCNNIDQLYRQAATTHEEAQYKEQL